MSKPHDLAIQDESTAPALADRPSKLFVEVTTRCNLHCSMCVKQTEGNQIVEGDLSLESFKALVPAMRSAEALILNGIGEPLLHPRLESFITLAKKHMPENSWVGFQTNGLLLSDERVRSLVAAGLDRICLSVDAISPELYCRVRSGSEIGSLENAFDVLNRAVTGLQGDPLKIGIEFVLQRDNCRELPAAIRWAAERGARFAIVTHMIAYDPDAKPDVAYDPNTDEAVALFNLWQEKSKNEGIDIADYYKIRWNYHKTPEDQRIIDFVEAMVFEAADRDIFFNLSSLLERDEALVDELNDLFEEAGAVADAYGMELHLPAVSPRWKKKCDFIESGSLFVSWQGDIHPCFFLWHKYTCFVAEWQKYVNPRIFGNLSEQDILSIWNSDDFRSFRRTVIGYEYPLCSNCNLAPCDYIDSLEFEQDCYTNAIPCCDCQWCLGVFRCMQ